MRHLFGLTQRRGDSRPPPTRAEFKALPSRVQGDFADLAVGVIEYLSKEAPISVQEAMTHGMLAAARIAETHNTGKAAAEAIRGKAGHGNEE